MYKIKDRQTNEYFSNGKTYKNLQEVCNAIINYHNIDCNMSLEQELYNQGKYEECWKSLDNFEWDLELIKQ